jgi:hypothetical protein
MRSETTTERKGKLDSPKLKSYIMGKTKGAVLGSDDGTLVMRGLVTSEDRIFYFFFDHGKDSKKE